MPEKEMDIIQKLVDVIPKMSEFDKGYLLGRVETIAERGEQIVAGQQEKVS